MFRKIYDKNKEIILYTLIAVLVGIIVGIVDTIFGKILLSLSKLRDDNILLFLPFLPLAGVFIMLLYKKYSKKSMKGMTLVFETGLGMNDRIPVILVPLVILSTWITHLFGGSAGREGVAVQIGATVSHSIGKKLKLQDNSRILLVTGMAAGFAGLFQTPLAATFFAIEVLIAGTMQYEALLPAITASFVASYTSHFLGLEKFTVLLNDTLSVTPNVVLKLIIIGIIFGIVGGIFAKILFLAKEFFGKIIQNPLKRIFILGIGLAGVLLLLHMGRYSGLGTNLIEYSFSGQKIYAYDWVIKFLLTIITLSVGFQGGEVTPLFSIGASLGKVLAGILGLPPMLIAAFGYVAVFGSATNTLFAPILIGAEVFGGENALYFAVICTIAYIFNGNKSIYASQRRS